MPRRACKQAVDLAPASVTTRSGRDRGQDPLALGGGQGRVERHREDAAASSASTRSTYDREPGTSSATREPSSSSVVGHAGIVPVGTDGGCSAAGGRGGDDLDGTEVVERVAGGGGAGEVVVAGVGDQQRDDGGQDEEDGGWWSWQ